MLADYKKRRQESYQEHCIKFIEDNCPYKKGEVLEVKSFFRTRKMKIDHVALRWVNNIPVIIAYGFYLNRTGKETKRYNKRGIGVYGIEHLALKINRVEKAHKPDEV